MLCECRSTGVAGAFLRVIGFYQVCQVNISEASDSPKHKEISQLLFILEGYDDITCVCTGNSIFWCEKYLMKLQALSANNIAHPELLVERGRATSTNPYISIMA